MEMKKGDTYQHIGNQRLYKIRGFSLHQSDDEHDGKRVVEYEGEGGNYSQLEERFLLKFKFWSIAGCKC